MHSRYAHEYSFAKLKEVAAVQTLYHLSRGELAARSKRGPCLTGRGSFGDPASFLLHKQHFRPRTICIIRARARVPAQRLGLDPLG
jgi:hypothetical protein